MTRIVLQAPELGAESIELVEGEALLAGRQPEAADLSGEVPPGLERPPRGVALASPSVSANHALVWVEGGTVCVRDVGSRNGSWLFLPRRQTVRVPAGQSVILQLAAPEHRERGDGGPADASWSGSEDFGPGLVRAVQDWLARVGIPATVSLHGGKGAETLADEPGRIPVAGGRELRLSLQETMDRRWARVLQQLWEYVSRQNLLFEAERQTREEGLILASRSIREAHREVVDAAARSIRILLLGPSGAGKEGLARTYHRRSGRSGSFVALNCSMFGKDLLRSELFGAEEGAFTGATQKIIGAVERANGGTLFLDEVADMPPEVQPMLLRFLDSGEYERLGGYGRPKRADVRIVCATNKDLRAATLEGRFRADLWYRLSIQVIDVPPLRERWEDLAAYLRTRSLGERVTAYDTLTPESLELLRAHRWEGNFRELANFVQRLPREAVKGSIDAKACRRALEQGALLPVAPLPQEAPRPPVEGLAPGDDWEGLATQVAATAVRAFIEDHQHAPRTWDDQKELNEKYLKPLLLFHMSGAAQFPVPRTAEEVVSLAHRVAPRVSADRGTAVKQLTRYFERFGG
ncbi:sigma 54-interacting transcriptional regulator [Pyxidicoccus trucidator]|uniref:sigma 54-interacting transcriptional regulator n=1 Tax=Pyxidicoccus trucidator TaxID=2709662 RepID=UPI0013DBA50D|nr:sigma 54-interacting transcriptional regulator [Pyxidicoccus trucidator]